MQLHFIYYCLKYGSLENIGKIDNDFFVISPNVSFDDESLFPALGKVFINPRGVYSIMKKNVPDIIKNMNAPDDVSGQSEDGKPHSPASLEEKLVEEMIVL